MEKAPLLVGSQRNSVFSKELLILVRNSLPSVAASFSQYVLVSMNSLICQRAALADTKAVIIANSIIVSLAFNVGLGFATACITFFSQVRGSGNSRRIGIYLIRGFYLMSVIGLIIAIAFCYSAPILNVLINDAHTAWTVGHYLKITIPAIFMAFGAMVLISLLQSLNVIMQVVIVLIFGILVSAGLNYLVLFTLHWQYEANAVVFDIVALVTFVCSLLCVVRSRKREEIWSGWSRQSLDQVYSFVRLGIPGIAVFALEGWYLDVAAVFVQQVGPVAVSSQKIAAHLEMTLRTITIGFAQAVAIRIGMNAGGNHPELLNASLRAAFGMVPVVGAVLSALLYCFQEEILSLYTSDPAVIELTLSLVPFLIGLRFIDLLLGVLNGMAIGLGAQSVAASAVTIGICCFSLPVGITLMLSTTLSIAGIWYGLLVGGLIQLLVYGWHCSSWDTKMLCSQVHQAVKNAVTHRSSGDSTSESIPMLEVSSDSISSSQRDGRKRVQGLPLDRIEDDWQFIGDHLMLRTLLVYGFLISAFVISYFVSECILVEPSGATVTANQTTWSHQVNYTTAAL